MRTDQLASHSLGPRAVAWEMPGERAIALVWNGPLSTIAIAPTLEMARQLAEAALAG